MSYVVEEKKVKRKGKGKTKGKYFPKTEKVIKLIKKEPRGRAQEIKELYSGLSYSDKLALIQLKKLSDEEAIRRQRLFSKAYTGDSDEIPLDIAEKIARSKLRVLEAEVQIKKERGKPIPRRVQEEILKIKRTFPSVVKEETLAVVTGKKPTKRELTKVEKEEKKFRQVAQALIDTGRDPSDSRDLIRTWNENFPEDEKSKAGSKFTARILKAIEEIERERQRQEAEEYERQRREDDDRRERERSERTSRTLASAEELLAEDDEPLPVADPYTSALPASDEEQEEAGGLPVKHQKILKRFVSTHKPSKKQLANATLLLKAMHMHDKKKR